MNKVVTQIQPLAKKVSPYVLPGLIRIAIRNEKPKYDENVGISPYVIPGLKRQH